MASSTESPHIVLIMADHLRRDSLSCYGDMAVNTPNLDALAQESAAFSMALAIAVARMASSPAWLWVAFALLGVSVSADSVSRMNIILEFCDPEDRPTYIGMTNTLLAPARALAPIIGGWLATWAGYRGMFVVGLLVSMLASALLALWVREPRPAQREAAGGTAVVSYLSWRHLWLWILASFGSDRRDRIGGDWHSAGCKCDVSMTQLRK